jgi:hypothetical protein
MPFTEHVETVACFESARARGVAIVYSHRHFGIIDDDVVL